jgi:hypothetical protein
MYSPVRNWLLSYRVADTAGVGATRSVPSIAGQGRFKAQCVAAGCNTTDKMPKMALHAIRRCVCRACAFTEAMCSKPSHKHIKLGDWYAIRR